MKRSPTNVTLRFLVFSSLWFAALELAVSRTTNSWHITLQFAGIMLYLAIASILIFRTSNQVEKATRSYLKRTRKLLKQIIADRNRRWAVLSSLPVPVWEEDFSLIKRFIDTEIKPQSVSELKSWLLNNPAQAKQLSQKVVIRSVSGTTLKMYGAETEEQLLNGLSNVFTEKSHDVFIEEILTFYGGTYFFNAEVEQKRLNGEVFLASTSISIPEYGRHDWDRIIVAIEDVTEKNRARTIVDNFFNFDINLHLICTPAGDILRVNSGWENVLGYKQDAIVGGNFLKFIHPDDYEQSRSELSALKKGGRTYAFENRIKHRNGTYLTFSWSAVSPQSDNIIYAVAKNITEQRESEIKLRDAALVMSSTSEGVFLCSPTGNITDVNQSFEKITGYSRNEVIGKSPGILKSGRHNTEFYDAMWESLVNQGRWEGEIWNRKKNGEIFPEFLKVNSVRDNHGAIVAYAGTFTDLTTIKDSEDKVIRLSTHDALTGLPNRGLLEEQILRAIDHATRNENLLALILFDIDNFKYINESFGFKTGDNVIKMIANRIRSSARAEDVVARSNSDEYAVLIENLDHAKDASVFVKNILGKFTEPFDIEGVNVHFSIGAGISVFPHDGQSPDILVRNAESALYKAKSTGRGHYSFYSEQLTEEATTYLHIENALRTALARSEFYLVYQPQLNLKTNRIEGIETLIRWSHPELGTISPAEFIPIAEQSGLINEIGIWVLENACHQAKQWIDQGYEFGRLAVNLSASQLNQKGVVATINEIVARSKLPPKCLELEVTETFAMHNPDKSIKLLSELRKTGIEIAVDDFGTGYSSLTYLKQLPIDKLKIDQSFVKEITEEHESSAIVEAIISLAQSLGLKTIAEGIETKYQWHSLENQNCDMGQGYLFSKPIIAPELERTFLSKSTSRQNHQAN